MNPESIGHLFGHPIARAIGWSLVHFIWQGVLIGIAASAAFALLGRARGQARYLVGCATFDAATRKAYLEAADTIKSSYEKNRALAALARTRE